MLDANACLSYWTQVPDPIPEPYRAALGPQVYGCDICQDVCPWNRGVERRRARRPADPAGHVDLLAWLSDDEQANAEALRRLYVPRNDRRYLRRNALVAAGNLARPAPGSRERLAAYAGGGDTLLAEHARWSLARLEESCG